MFSHFIYWLFEQIFVPDKEITKFCPGSNSTQTRVTKINLYSADLLSGCIIEKSRKHIFWFSNLCTENYPNVRFLGELRTP